MESYNIKLNWISGHFWNSVYSLKCFKVVYDSIMNWIPYYITEFYLFTKIQYKIHKILYKWKPFERDRTRNGVHLWIILLGIEFSMWCTHQNIFAIEIFDCIQVPFTYKLSKTVKK